MTRIIILLGIILLTSCQQDRSTSTHSSSGLLGLISAKDMAYEEEMQIEPPRTMEPPEAPMEKGSKIIKSGNMSIEVSDLNNAKVAIDTLLKTVDGFYENESFEKHYNRVTYNLRLRIPNKDFDTLLDAIENGLGLLTAKHIHMRDITEEYVDLNIRLENKLSYLQQYRNILKKAKTIEEILEVQEKIRNIEEEIESKKGRLKYLNDQVTYSTLNLQISQLTSNSAIKRPGLGLRIGNAFKTGVKGFLNFVVSLVSVWPLVIFFVIVFLSRRKISRWFRRKKS